MQHPTVQNCPELPGATLGNLGQCQAAVWGSVLRCSPNSLAQKGVLAVTLRGRAPPSPVHLC
eukprot:13594839-Alexandrium_andersonii.AAC.1